MATTATYSCDCCGQSFNTDKGMGHFSTRNCNGVIDICLKCQTRIVQLVVIGKPFDLRPFCTHCKGTGKLPDDVDQGDHITHSTKQCHHCNLWRQPK